MGLLVVLIGCTAPSDPGTDPDTNPHTNPHEGSASQTTGTTHTTATIDTLDVARQLAARGTDLWVADLMLFDWIPTVWTFGLLELHAADGEERWRDYVVAFIEDHLPDFQGADPEAFVSSDSMSPALLAAMLMREDSGLDYSAITIAADAYLAGAQRTDEGAITHWGPDNPWGLPDDQVWVDSQFMFGMYLLEMYAMTGDGAYRDLWWEQHALNAALCLDPGDQLYRHAYDDATDTNIPQDAVYWARGNSWPLLSGARALALLDPTEDAALREEVSALVAAHADALVSTQADDGLWHTILNAPEDPANYTETSAAALIALGLAWGIDGGALPADGPAAQAMSRTVDGLTARVVPQEDGSVVLEGTSWGTNPGEYEDYLDVPQMDDLMLGYGAVIAALAALDGRPAP